MRLRKRRIRSLRCRGYHSRCGNLLLRIHRFRLRRYHRRGSERSAEINSDSDHRLVDRSLPGIFRCLHGLDHRRSLLRAGHRGSVTISLRRYRLELGLMAGNHRRYLRSMFQVKLLLLPQSSPMHPRSNR